MVSEAAIEMRMVLQANLGSEAAADLEAMRKGTTPHIGGM